MNNHGKKDTKVMNLNAYIFYKPCPKNEMERKKACKQNKALFVIDQMGWPVVWTAWQALEVVSLCNADKRHSASGPASWCMTLVCERGLQKLLSQYENYVYWSSWCPGRAEIAGSSAILRKIDELILCHLLWWKEVQPDYLTQPNMVVCLILGIWAYQ